MGNCQAIDAATLVIQHPNGKVERLYGAVNASEIMKINPGHYVALLISTTLSPNSSKTTNGEDHASCHTTASTGSVRITRIKLLRPIDALVLGQVYRLVTTQGSVDPIDPATNTFQIVFSMWVRKQAKGKRPNIASRRSEGANAELDKDNNQVVAKTHRPRTLPSSPGSNGNSQAADTARPRTWQPSLQSISEAAS